MCQIPVLNLPCFYVYRHKKTLETSKNRKTEKSRMSLLWAIFTRFSDKLHTSVLKCLLKVQSMVNFDTILTHEITQKVYNNCKETSNSFKFLVFLAYFHVVSCKTFLIGSYFVGSLMKKIK